MQVGASGFRALRVYLEMIKFEHSIFALPFAMIGMMWAGDGWPGLRPFLLIVVAMVSCRSAAMAFNRIVDRDIDAKNPRTKARAIPARLLQVSQVTAFFLASCAIFFLAAAALNRLSLLLSPVALGVTLFYSFTKRFTWLSHWVLGLSLGIAPAAAWIACRGAFDPRTIWLVGAVTLWTAGFDILYSLQDATFDREQGLRSLPQTIGIGAALWVSRCCHFGAVACLAGAGIAFGAGAWYGVGVLLAAALLGYEQSLVKPTDLSRINVAFFTLNGFVSIGVFAFAWADEIARASSRIGAG